MANIKHTTEHWLSEIKDKGSNYVRLQLGKELETTQKFMRLALEIHEKKQADDQHKGTRDLQKTGNNIQLGVLVVLVLTLFVTCSQQP